MIDATYRHIKSLITAALTAVAMLAVPACGSDSLPDENPAIEADEINVSFTISTGALPDPEPGSRYTISQAFGNMLECYIDINNFDVMLFGSDRKLKTVLFSAGTPGENTKFERTGEYQYVVSTWLDPEQYNRNSEFAIVARVNWPGADSRQLVPGETSLDDFADDLYTINSDPADPWYPTIENPMPMFGSLHGTLRYYSSEIYSESNPMNLGDVNLVRAMAKIEVVDNSKDTKTVIENIELIRRNRQGRLMQDFDFNGATSQVTKPTIPSDPMFTETKIPLMRRGNVWSLYVPEYEFDIRLVERQCIAVSVEVNDNKEVRWIYLAPYGDDGQPQMPSSGDTVWKSLLRNHLYRFTIASLYDSVDLDLIVDVQPYAEIALDPVFGLERTADGYIVVRNSDGSVKMYIRADGAKLTFKTDSNWPEIGPAFMGVFDDLKCVLIGYFPDGRMIFFNYEDKNQTTLKSWEIYSGDVEVDKNAYITETFNYSGYSTPGNQTYTPAFCHDFYDSKEYLTERYVYASLADFKARDLKVRGDKAKTKYYYTYKANGTIKSIRTVTATSDTTVNY